MLNHLESLPRASYGKTILNGLLFSHYPHP